MLQKILNIFFVFSIFSILSHEPFVIKQQSPSPFLLSFFLSFLFFLSLHTLIYYGIIIINIIIIATTLTTTTTTTTCKRKKQQQIN